MQRYDPSAEIWGQMDHYSDGRYVLYLEAQAEIDTLKGNLAASVAAREEMILGGNKLAESLWFSKCRAEDLEAEIEALHAECDRLTALLGNQLPVTQEEEEECQHEYRYESRGAYLCLFVCQKCGDILDED